MSLQDLLLLVFCLVDDHLKALGLHSPRLRGPEPELADSEVITIELVGEHLGPGRDARLSWHFRQHHPRELPALARVHRTTSARQAANLFRVKQLLQRHLAGRLEGPTADWLVDGMPLPACRLGRGGFCKGLRGLATFGYDPAQRQTCYGFRLHLRTSRRGVVLACELAPANASDLAVLPELAPPSGTTGIGDRNYWSPQAAAELAESGVRLLAPYRSRGRDPDPARSRRPGRPRRRVEAVNSQLAGRYSAKRLWARDLWHLCHRLIRKVLSHTVAVWVSARAGRPPLQLAALMAA